jgi:hypothetical protein
MNLKYIIKLFALKKDENRQLEFKFKTSELCDCCLLGLGFENRLNKILTTVEKHIKYRHEATAHF